MREMRKVHRGKKRTSTLLLNQMPSRSTPGSKEATRRPHKPRPLGTSRPRQAASRRNHRNPRIKHRPEHLGKLHRSVNIDMRHRARLRARRRHRMHRPRQRHLRRNDRPESCRTHRELPEQLHRNLTQRKRPTHLGNLTRNSRHTPHRKRHKRRTLLHRQIHHHHRQRLPARNTPTAVTDICTRADLRPWRALTPSGSLGCCGDFGQRN